MVRLKLDSKNKLYLVHTLYVENPVNELYSSTLYVI